MYLIPHNPEKEMRVGEVYALVFEVSSQRPSDPEAVKLLNNRSYLQVEGIDSSWTDQDLIQPIGGEDIIIEIKPPAGLRESRVELRAKVTIGELGSVLHVLYDETVHIVGNAGPAPIAGQPARKAAVESSAQFTVIIKLPEDPLPNLGVLYAISSGGDLLFFAQRGDGKTAHSGEPLKLSNTAYLSLNAYIGTAGLYDNLSGLGKNLYHELDSHILRWLAELLEECKSTGADQASVPQCPYLLIYDSTGVEIPWELIYFEPRERGGTPHGFLGALAAVARWSPIKKHGEVIAPDFIDLPTSGRVISYVPKVKDFLADIEEEVNALKECRCSLMTSADALRNGLDEQHDDVALVHIASHGTFVADKPAAAGLHLEEDDFTALELSNREMRLLGTSRPVVFINACHSGRGIGLGWGLNGLQVPFIRQGARGLIGVMGRVRSRAAAGIAKRLLQEMRQDSPKSIAEILRRIRAEAAAKIKGLSTEEQKYFLDSFMYVFYGSPLKSLRLLKDEAEGGE